MNRVKVLIVDDPIILYSLRIMLEKEQYEVVGEAKNGIEALLLAMKLMPNVVILDINLVDVSGFDVIKRLCMIAPDVRVLIFSKQNPRYFALRCMQAGASGYVYKGSDIEDIMTAMKVLTQGSTYFPQNLHSAALPVDNSGSMNEAEIIAKLNTRELVTLKYLAEGKSNKEIGALTSLSNKTVSSYKVKIMQKLNAQTIPDLVDFARRNELV